MTRKKQPVRVAPAESYGQRQQLEQQQQAAPLDNARALLDTATQGPVQPEYGVFGPSQRPSEPITAGVPVGPGPGRMVGDDLANDPELLLQAMIAVFPHPSLIAMLDRGV